MRNHLILNIYVLFIIILFQFNCFADVQYCMSRDTDTGNLEFFNKELTDTPLHVWVHTEGALAFDCFKKPYKIQKPLTFRKRYKIVNYNYRVRYNKQYWSLLVDGEAEQVSKKNIVGWVSHNNLLINNEPLKHKETGIFQKALINNGDSDNGEALLIYTHPEGKKFRRNDNGEQVGIKVRTVYYVYDFYPEKAREPDSEKTERILISADSFLDTLAPKSYLLIGWVDRKMVTFWNTRTAFEFKQGIRGKIRNDEGKVIFKTKTIDRPLEYDELRNPIFEKTNGRYKVGVFARLTREQLGLRRKLKNLYFGIEVLFVIDGTRSMTSAFQSTLSAVKEIANELENKSKEHGLSCPKYAMALYRDKATLKSGLKKEGNKTITTDNPSCKKEVDINKMSNYRRFINFLEEQIACDADKTMQESMYQGIIQGLNKCGFKAGEGKNTTKNMRIVIHMGDAGDNGSGNYNSQSVSRELTNYVIHRYFTVNIDKNSNEFSKSVRDISPSSDKGKAVHENDFDDLKKLVISQLNFSYKAAVETRKQIDIISRGFAGSNQGRIGEVTPEILNYAKEIIKGHGYNTETLNTFQKYTEGWISENDNIRESILISRTDISNITKFLYELNKDMDNARARRNTWENSLKFILGEQNCEINGQPISLEECNNIRNGIPIKAGFMRYNRYDFLNLSRENVKIVKCEAKLMLEQFNAFYENKYMYQFKIKDNDNCIYDPVFEYDINEDGIVNPPAKKISNKMLDKFFYQEGDESMAWIPTKYLDLDISLH